MEARARARETIRRVATAGGVRDVGDALARVVRGTPGPTLVALGRSENAALVAVSASTRGPLVRTLMGSATGHLVRRCDRPVLVCPRDPASALRVREWLSAGAPQWQP
jgi:nucleotide-binding universal stress UspA family protein